jgi:hypothetical protein
MLCGNRHHSWNIEQLCLAAMGKSLPQKRRVHKQTHVPDTTGMEKAKYKLYKITNSGLLRRQAVLLDKWFLKS